MLCVRVAQGDSGFFVAIHVYSPTIGVTLMTKIISTTMAFVCTFILVGPAPATEISLSLNLEFDNPSDFGSGGDWTVVAKADERGIAAIVLELEDSTLNFDPLTGFLTPVGFEVEFSAVFGLRLEIAQGDDLSDPTLDVGVIGGTYPSTYVDDPLLTVFGANPDLGSFTGGVELATGTFDPGDIPAWFNDGTDKSGGNLFIDALGTVAGIFDARTTVRFVAIPEPNTATLATLGLTVLGCRLRKRA